MTKKKVSDEDIDLFRQAIGSVQTINTDKIHFKTRSPKPYPKGKISPELENWQRNEKIDTDAVGHEQTLLFTAPGVQQAVLTKLRKGVYGIQGEIDLHGLTSEVAKRELLIFLQNQIARGSRCIHIIHGKGYRSNDSQPVLKNQINRWLREHKEVLAFCSAPPRQGGAGAVLVLLKQQPA